MRVAAVQLTSTADLERNLERADRFTRAAAADGAQLVVLPEKWSVLGRGDDLRAGAQPLDGPVVRWARHAARELGIDLVAGSICEREDPEREACEHPQPRLRNTSLHIGPDGEIHATYRKLHMFDVVVDGTVYRESDHERAGDEIVLSETSDGVGLGLSICYDVRFPELYRILAIGGARILTVPAAFTVPTTRDHWEVLLRARAIENQAFVIAANQLGEHAPASSAGPALRSGGRSMIVDPWGIVLALAADREGHIVADLDLDAQERIRRELPALACRRPGAYRWPVEARP
ncbi:MAG TPA: carbon-nitrogen hydrolase family protein [Solirubrobacteraceae bacterium]|jgi:predicted amidohydrolase|nr:carbon-nitrogen hydrolase family protein [Solirubrobacteraceae bacterium]